MLDLPVKLGCEMSSQSLDKELVTNGISDKTKHSSSDLIKADSKNIKAQRKERKLTQAASSFLKRSASHNYIIVLTYQDGVNHENDHIVKFRKSLEGYEKKNKVKVSIIWSFEYGKNGRPHYHLLINVPWHCFNIKNVVKKAWKHGRVDINIAMDVLKCAKYISKKEGGKKAPKGTRTYGVTGLTREEQLECAFVMLPFWKQNLIRIGLNVKSCKGGMLNIDTGEFYESPYLPVFIGGHVYLKKTCHPWMMDLNIA